VICAGIAMTGSASPSLGFARNRSTQPGVGRARGHGERGGEGAAVAQRKAPACTLETAALLQPSYLLLMSGVRYSGGLV
jgi:hypothetical protein